MNFFVIGCNGMAGHLISLYLYEQDHDVMGYARSCLRLVPSETGDVRDVERIKAIVAEGHFDTIINCVGLLNQFAESDKASAVFLNAYFPHFLADITAGTDTQVIHMSTDCVFSGKRGEYTEHDLRDGETFYDRSKALGELEDEKNLTLRNSIVGPDIKESGIGLLNWFMKNTVKADSLVNGYTKAVWSGQTTLQLAKTMEAAARERVHGLYNMVSAQSITKYELLQLFNKYLRSGQVLVNPVEGINADKSLKRTNFDFSYEIPDYETMVAEMAIWIKEHKALYPHYAL